MNMTKPKDNSAPGQTVEDGEPRENDKLATEENGVDTQDKVVVESKPVKKQKNRFEFIETRFQSAKDHLASNPHHRIVLLLALVIFILTIIVLILSIRLGTINIPEQQNICETPNCLQAAASIVGALNFSYEPCQDFWSYACRGWIKRNPIPDNRGSWSIRDQVVEKTNHELRHLIDLIPRDSDSSSPETKVRLFYSSCMNIEDIHYTALNTLKYDIKEIGGWSLINSWSIQEWNRNSVIERLHSRFGVEPYFKVSVGPDDLDPNQPFIIKILPGGLGLPSKSYYYDFKYEKQVAAYKSFMKETAKLFEATAIQANQFAENTFNYEKRIAEVTPDLEDYQQPSEYIRKRYSIRELTNIAPSISWLQFFQNYFKNAKINEGTRVLVAFEQYFRDISNIISTTDNTAANDYLMWRFTSQYAQYLSNPFRLIHNDFNQIMNGIEYNNMMAEDRWEFCIRATTKFLGPALGSIYVKHKLHEKVVQASKAQNVIISIRNAMLNKIDSFTWAQNDDAKRLVKEKLENMELLVGFPKFLTKDGDLKLYYNEMSVYQNNFYQNILHGVHFFHRKNEMLLNSRQSVTDFSWRLVPQDIDLNYQYAGNKLIVPSGFLQPPFFDQDLPTPLQFGAFGFHVAAEMLRAFDLVGLQYGLPDFRLSQTHPWFPEEAKVSFDNKLQCLYGELKRYSELTQYINPNLTYSKTYTDIGALNFAYQAYKSWMNIHGDQGTLHGTYRDNDELFFVGFAQSMCEAVRPRKSLVLSDAITQLPGQIRVSTVLRQSTKFASEFQCQNSPMTSDSMCHLW